MIPYIDLMKILMRSIVPALLVVLLAGCISTPEMTNRWSFTCRDGHQFQVVYDRDKESLEYTDAENELRLKLLQNDGAAVEPLRYVGEYSTDDNQDHVLVFVPAGVMADLIVDGDDSRVACQGNAY